MAFGGAGPLHATDIADELGIDRILIPRASGVLAALGLVVSPRRRDVQRSVFLAGDEVDGEAVRGALRELVARAERALAAEVDAVRVIYELRYAGQSFELPIEADPEGLREAFEAEHEARYGYRDGGAELELVTIRVSVTAAAPALTLSGRDALPSRITGPALIRLPESALVVPEGWRGTTGATGTIDLRRG
jgi:N-methylhydantoinase A